MKKVLKKAFAGLLAVALLLSSSAFGAQAHAAGFYFGFGWGPRVTEKAVDATFKLEATNYDWGEAITSVVIDLKTTVDYRSVDAADFVFSNDYSYMDYSDYSTKTGTVVREVESVQSYGNLVVLNLKTDDMSDAHKFTALALTSAKIEYVGEVTSNRVKITKDSTFTCEGVENPEIDAFLEDSTDYITYRLYVPKKLTGKNPLVVWLHGAGETGSDNRAQIAGNPVVNFANKENQKILDNAFVLAPQYDSARGVEGVFGHNPAWVMEAIEKVLGQYNIDQDRIYVGGCSMGGLGTVNMLKAYPTFFAAAFPICPAGELNAEDCAKIAAPAAEGKKTTAVYLIHCIEDNTCNPNATFHTYKNLVDAYKALGVEEDKIPAYTALFSQVDFDGCPDGFQEYLSHWSWLYPENNFDGLGDDYDGKNFISSSVDREFTSEGGSYTYGVREGNVVFIESVVTKATYDGQDVTGYYQWLQYMIPDYDPTKLVIETLDTELYAKSLRPCEIGEGYANFLTWLSAQSLGEKEQEEEYTWYVIQPGDSIFTIAFKVFGNVSNWIKIWRANMDKLGSYYNLKPGTRICIPLE